MQDGTPIWDVAALRAIGWARWNPIGLAGPPATPANEYDVYLVAAARLLLTGAALEQVRDYLSHIETAHMGLPPPAGTRATDTAIALKSYLDGLAA